MRESAANLVLPVGNGRYRYGLPSLKPRGVNFSIFPITLHKLVGKDKKKDGSLGQGQF